MKTLILFVITLIVAGCAKKPNLIALTMQQIEAPRIFSEVLPDQEEPIILFDEDSVPDTRIYFALGSHIAPDKADLIKEAEAIKAIPGRVVITGHACPIGNHGSNYRLGLNRALAVMKVMHTMGIGYDKFIVKSVGETELITTEPKYYHLNRWVGFSKE